MRNFKKWICFLTLGGTLVIGAMGLLPATGYAASIETEVMTCGYLEIGIHNNNNGSALIAFVARTNAPAAKGSFRAQVYNETVKEELEKGLKNRNEVGEWYFEEGPGGQRATLPITRPVWEVGWSKEVSLGVGLYVFQLELTLFTLKNPEEYLECHTKEGGIRAQVYVTNESGKCGPKEPRCKPRGGGHGHRGRNMSVRFKIVPKSTFVLDDCPFALVFCAPTWETDRR